MKNASKYLLATLALLRLNRTLLPRLLIAISLATLTAFCADDDSLQVQVKKDIPYKTEQGLSDYEKERCKFDLYLPQGKTAYPTLVWFHGGGLTAGSKEDDGTVRIGRRLAETGVAVAMANYRLSPKAKYPGYIEDAAAAVAWVRTHIAESEGDPHKLFVGGHSAGAYLTLMVGLDPRYLRQHGLETSMISGLIPVSGQTMTHYTVREERGLSKDRIIADEAAPVHYARKDAPPMLVLVAERDMPARAEENQYLVAALKAAGHEHLSLQIIADRDHGSVGGRIAEPGDPAARTILSFIKANSSALEGTSR